MDFGIQHAFTNNLSLEVSYVGNHGHLSGLVDVNAATPGLPPRLLRFSPAKNEQVRRPYYNQFPYLSTIQYFTDDQRSNYNALQASLVLRPTHGLYFTLGYTYVMRWTWVRTNSWVSV